MTGKRKHRPRHRLSSGTEDDPAILAQDRATLSHGGLRHLNRKTIAQLNPRLRADELDFYLTDIGAKVILVGKDEDGP
ncbi:hypothetical protein [Mesorhizobium sp. M0977]|uniref:hypothetical protein n=1 Tax=Mesorhizobium sp. M0977 TaxID=2957039 RepID=UPI0033377D7C